jgi:hypothetical protein
MQFNRNRAAKASKIFVFYGAASGKVSDNYFVYKGLWKQKFFGKTAKILFLGGACACFWANDAVFYRSIGFQRETVI